MDELEPDISVPEEQDFMDGAFLSDSPMHYEIDVADDKTEDGDETLDIIWENFMKRLIEKEIRWDDVEQKDDKEWNPRVGILTTKERESLAGNNPIDKTRPTILHRLAVDFNSEGFETLPEQTRVKIIEYLLQHRKHNLTPGANRIEDPILTRAFENDNLKFIEFIVHHCKTSLPDLLDAADNGGMNCLHYIFKDHLPKSVGHYWSTSQVKHKAGKPSKRNLKIDLRATIEKLPVFVGHARPQCIAARDNDGNTPIHYALEYKLCRTPIKQYSGIVLGLIKTGDEFLNSKEHQASQFNKKDESPYRYFERTRRNFIAALQKKNKTPTRSSIATSAETRVGQDVQAMPHDATGKSTGAGSEARNAGVVTTRGKTDIEISIVATSSIETGLKSRKDLITSIKGAVERSSNNPHHAGGSVTGKPRPITHNPAAEKQVTQESLPTIAQDHPKFTEVAKDILRRLKIHYIRSRSDMEAKELLYGKMALGIYLAPLSTNYSSTITDWLVIYRQKPLF